MGEEASSREASGTDRPDQRRTHRARRDVVDAAHDAFVARGFSATSIAEISDASGVPVATVYRLFRNKVGILRAVLDVAIAGDHRDQPVAGRPPVQTALGEADSRSRIAGFARVTADINRRVAPIYRALANAADADAAAAELFQSIADQRRRGQGLLVRSLAESGTLRPELSPERASDIVHALMSPETYRSLVTDRGWTPDEFTDWLTATLCTQLLHDDIVSPAR